MKTIIIVRHGNTFEPHETPRRIGHTDLPLTDYGQEQIVQVSNSLKSNNLNPTLVLSSPLKRAQLSAQILANSFNISHPIQLEADLTEIHYGPDENQTDEVIRARIGSALADWNEHSLLPNDWPETKESLMSRWDRLIEVCEKHLMDHSTVVLVTSQGIARFAPFVIDITPSLHSHSYRLNTAHYSLIQKKQASWEITQWNQA